MSRMPVTEADFQLQGRVDNYREQLFELLIALDEELPSDGHHVEVRIL